MITCRGRGKVARVITKILTEYRLKILFFDKNSHIFGSKSLQMGPNFSKCSVERVLAIMSQDAHLVVWSSGLCTVLTGHIQP